MTNIYVAGKWTDKDTIKKYMLELESMGHTITHDWTTFEFETKNTKPQMAFADIEGVKKADMVVILMTDPEYAYRGSFTELGAALALNKKIYLVSDAENARANYKTNVFFHHPLINHIESWSEFILNIDK
jgi:nucleoside 2-deoxyribosyltransferase